MLSGKGEITVALKIRALFSQQMENLCCGFARYMQLLSRIVLGTHDKAISFFFKNSRAPARTISDSLEDQTQRENEAAKGTHARF